MAIENGPQKGLEELLAGQVVVEETHLDERGGSVRVEVLVQAPAQAVWKVIGNCEKARRYLVGMESCEVLLDQPDRAVTHHVVDPGFLLPKMDYTFETIRRPYSDMQFELVEGTFKKMDGYWRLKSTEDGLVVEHELRIRPKMPVPNWVVRRKLKTDLPRMMTCIRGLSGGSPSPEMERSDMDSCEGPAAQ